MKRGRCHVHEEKGRRGVHRFRWQRQIFIRESHLHLLNEPRARSTGNGGNNGSTSADGERRRDWQL